MKGVNLETMTDVLSCHRIWPLSGYKPIRVGRKLLKRRKGVDERMSSCLTSRKSFYRIHWNLENLVKTSHGIIVRQHTNDPRRMDSWKSGTQNGWNAVGWFDRMLLIFEMSKTYWQMREHFMKSDLENHFKGLPVEYRPFSAKDHSSLHQCGKKVLLAFSSDVHCPREEFGQNFGHKHWGAGKFGRVRNQCKWNDYAEAWWKFHIPNRGWMSKIVWKRSWSPNIHSNGGPTCKGWRSQRKPSGKFGEVSTHRTKQRTTLKPAVFFGQPKEVSFLVITSNFEFSSMCRKKKRSQDHWNTLRWPELHMHMWTCFKKPYWRLLERRCGSKFVRFMWQDSQSSQYWAKQLPDLTVCGQRHGLACSITCTKAGLCSEVTLWETLRARTLFSQGKVGLRHKWWPQMWWMWLQDYLTAGQADAVSADTHVRMEDAPRMLKIPVRMSRYMDTSSTTWVTQAMDRHWRSCVSSGAKSVRTPTCGPLVEKTIRESSIRTRTGKSTNLWMSVCSSKKKDYSFRYAWMKSNWLEESRIWTNIIPWPCIWDVLTRECKPNESVLDEYRKMFESRIFAGATKKFAWLWEISHKNCRVVLRYGRTCKHVRWKILWANEQKDRTVVQSLNSLLGLPQFQEGGTGNVCENCPKYARKSSWIFLARIGGLDILWSANELARAVTECTRACDSARMLAFTQHTNDHPQYCHVGNTAHHCRRGVVRGDVFLWEWSHVAFFSTHMQNKDWVYSKTDFVGDPEDAKSTSSGILCFFRKSDACSHEIDAQEANINVSQFYRFGRFFFFLDAALRMDGIFALDLWVVVIEVLHSLKNTHQAVRDHCRKGKGRRSSSERSSTRLRPKHQPYHQIEKKQ